MAIDSRRTATEPRSRRAILAGAIGGLAGLIAGRVASPDKANAAAGDPLLIGNTSNNAGTTNTTLTTSSTGTGLLITQNGTGTALRGSAVGAGSIAGFFTANNGTGISGVTGNGNSYGVFAQNNGATGSAGAIRAAGGTNHGVVATTALSTSYAVKAVNNSAGEAVFGQSTATTAAAGVGVRGVTAGELGSGVVGVAGNFGGSGNGVWGLAVAPDGKSIYAQQAASTHGAGAAVLASGGQNHGVVATTETFQANAVNATQTASDSGVAIYGLATGVTGINVAVKGEISGDGYAVYGHASKASGFQYGLVGQTDGTDGIAVYGHAAEGTGTNFGVYGATDSTNGFGVYSNGKAQIAGALNVTGVITAGTKDFRIDHPLDPARKFLSHSCVESDQRRTIYDGEVTLDSKGEATVSLPAWFETVNRDVRYQLTAIGPTDRSLYVKARVKGNAFSIGGGNAGQVVCWQLSGVRQDPYARAHPLIVEASKAGTERERYLHPEVYGKPASKSIDALHTRSLPAPGH
jgi:hypothetical protein